MKFAIKSIAIAAVSLAAVTGLAACGSSSSTTSDAPPAATASPEETFKVGDTEVSSGLPSGWPDDVPTPNGLALKGGGGTPEGMSASWSGPGSVKTVQTQLDADFKANGFIKGDAFGTGDEGGLTSWAKGSTTVQVIVANQNGEVVVNETIVPNGS